jgi:hypothetical protein
VNIDYATLPADVESGALRERLQQELMAGFRQIHESGERLPTASHFASQITEIIHRDADPPVPEGLAFELYQEILEACEKAREAVLSERLE